MYRGFDSFGDQIADELSTFRQSLELVTLGFVAKAQLEDLAVEAFVLYDLHGV